MEDFLKKLFESREVTHVMHLRINNNSKHKALEEYYENIVDLIDDLAEAYQGQIGLLDITDLQMIENSDIDMEKPEEYIAALSTFVMNNRENAVPKEAKHLDSIVDEILILIFKTLYKLKNLS